MRPRSEARRQCDASFGASCRSNSEVSAGLAFGFRVSDKSRDRRPPVASQFASFTGSLQGDLDGSIVREHAAGSREETVMSRWNFGEPTKALPSNGLTLSQMLSATLSRIGPSADAQRGTTRSMRPALTMK